ncbi:hypothetical protein [Pilibacter termitis]|uniref:hypothetical protein n=1 Tax=Pilibacter termitis TaxID=263852 RepID=UPI001F45A4C9|nr:hypothetical protein [Pilibacter termitis]
MPFTCLKRQFQVALRTATRLQHFVARQRKAERGVLKSATANHVVYLFATKLRTTLRAVAKLQPHVARQNERGKEHEENHHCSITRLFCYRDWQSGCCRRRKLCNTHYEVQVVRESKFYL